jgi:hypothetical protein
MLLMAVACKTALMMSPAVPQCLILSYATSSTNKHQLCCSCCGLQLHPEAEDLLRGLLTYDAEQRLGSNGVHQIMQHPFFASVHWSSLTAEVNRDQQLHAEVQARMLQQQREEQQHGYGQQQQQQQQQHGYEQQQQQQEQLEAPKGRWGLPLQDDERERVYSRQW